MSWRLIGEPQPRAGATGSGQVVWIRQLAALQREAAAADAVIQVHVESLQFLDALGDLLLPPAR